MIRAGKGKDKRDGQAGKSGGVGLRRGGDRAGPRHRADSGGVGDPAAVTAAQTPTLPLSAIVLDPSTRTRVDMGDIDGLAQWIDDVGFLIAPIVVSPNGDGTYTLRAGHRRMLAWPRTRFAADEIPVRIVDVDGIAAGKVVEYAENAARKSFTWAEDVSLWLEVEPVLKEAAKKRQREHGGTAPGKTATSQGDAGRLRDQMTKVTGRGGKNMERAVEIYKAWQTDPAKYGSILEDMNKNGVRGAHKRLRNMQEIERRRAEPTVWATGGGGHRVMEIDPPWPSEPDKGDPGPRAFFPYQTMSIDDICALPVEDIANLEGCAVWLWVPNFHLVNGFHKLVLDAWGFKPVTKLTWIKPGMGNGQRMRGASEDCILAIRGKVPLNPVEKTWFEAPAGKHSEKPAEFYAIVERVTPASAFYSMFPGTNVPSHWARPDGGGEGAEHIREIPPDLVEAIRGRHFVTLPMPHLEAEGGPVTICTCDCGMEFRAPYGGSQVERVASINEIKRQVEAHWRAALEEEPSS